MNKYRSINWLSCGMPFIDGAPRLLETWAVYNLGNYRVAECCANTYRHNTLNQLVNANAKAKANAEKIVVALNEMSE